MCYVSAEFRDENDRLTGKEEQWGRKETLERTLVRLIHKYESGSERRPGISMKISLSFLSPLNFHPAVAHFFPHYFGTVPSSTAAHPSPSLSLQRSPGFDAAVGFASWKYTLANVKLPWPGEQRGRVWSEDTLVKGYRGERGERGCEGKISGKELQARGWHVSRPGYGVLWWNFYMGRS